MCRLMKKKKIPEEGREGRGNENGSRACKFIMGSRKLLAKREFWKNGNTLG